MKTLKIARENGEVIYEKVLHAKGFTERLMGLMFKRKEEVSGMLIEQCNSIHTCFMRFSIDVFFPDSSLKVVKIKRKLLPWRITRMYLSTQKVLEIPSVKNKVEIKEGDKLVIVDV